MGRTADLKSWGVRTPGSRVGVAVPNGPELMTVLLSVMDRHVNNAEWRSLSYSAVRGFHVCWPLVGQFREVPGTPVAFS